MSFFEHVRNQLRNWSEANITFANHIDKQVSTPKYHVNPFYFAIYRYLVNQDQNIRTNVAKKQLR